LYVGGGEKGLYLVCAFFILADLRNPEVGLFTVFLSTLFFFLRASILKIRGTGKFFMSSTKYIASNDFEAFRTFGTCYFSTSARDAIHILVILAQRYAV